MATPTYKPLPAILGTIASICTSADASAAPASDAEWRGIGRIKAASAEITEKSAEVEGFDPDGTYAVEEISVATKQMIKMTTMEMSAEALTLMFGIKGATPDALFTPGATGTFKPFARANKSLSCWLKLEVKNVTGGTEVCEMQLYGKLKLTNSPNISSDPVTTEWQFDVIKNAGATIA